jgi:hypothetical protein
MCQACFIAYVVGPEGFGFEPATCGAERRQALHRVVTDDERAGGQPSYDEVLAPLAAWPTFT